MKLPNSTKPNAFIAIAQVSLLFFVLVFLAGCNPGNKDSFAYDWKDISINNQTDLTRIQMLNEDLGFVGGFPKIDSFIYVAGYDVSVGGIDYDTLLFQTDDQPIVYYHLIRTVPAVPERCLFKTENGGLNWMSLQTPFISGIVDFRFIDESVGFVLTLKEGVYKTENGGMDWVKIVPEAFTTGYGVTYQNPFDAIGVQSTNHIYLLDREQDLIIESLNGGTSWQCISKGTPQLAYTFYLPEKCYFKTDSDTGYIKTSKGLHRTFDRGKSWEPIQAGLMVNDLAVEDSKLYITTTYNLYESDDCGSSISQLDLEASLNADRFAVFDDSLVYFTDNSKFNHPNMLKTMDWGKTKQVMTREREDNMMDFCFVSKNTGYLAGDNGMVLKYSSK